MRCVKAVGKEGNRQVPALPLAERFGLLPISPSPGSTALVQPAGGAAAASELVGKGFCLRRFCLGLIR